MMNRIMLALIVSSVSYILADDDSFVCPEEGLYPNPNPNDCQSYIQCDETGATPVVVDCEGGMEWNDNDKQCDDPDKSTCDRTQTTTTTIAPTYTTTTTTTTIA